MNLPSHKAGLFLTHNEHRSYYQPLSEWLLDHSVEPDEWAGEGQKERALADDSCWCLQWYPDTPIGSYSLYAADLDVLLAAARGYDLAPSPTDRPPNVRHQVAKAPSPTLTAEDRA